MKNWIECMIEKKCNISTTLHGIHQHGTFRNGIYCGHFPLTVFVILFLFVFQSGVGDKHTPSYTNHVNRSLSFCLNLSISCSLTPAYSILTFNHSNKLMPLLKAVWWFHCNRSDVLWENKKEKRERERERESYTTHKLHIYLCSKYFIYIYIYTRIE